MTSRVVVPSAGMADQLGSPAHKAIRKIRKKLRQIEHLELLGRELNDEEALKVSRKIDLRKDLRKLLKEHPQDENDVMKRQSIHHNEEESNIKKSKSIDSSNLKQEIPDELELQDSSHQFDTSASGPEHQERLASLSSSRSSPFDPTSIPSPVLYPIETHAEKIVSGAENTPVKLLASSETQHHCVSQKAVKVEGKPQTSKSIPKGSNADNLMIKESALKRESAYEVFTLEGHNDIILGVDCIDNFVLSASRDTTVRVWRIGKTKEERSLRGHTAAVTAVAFLPEPLAAAVLAKLETDYDDLPFVQGRVSSECRILAVSGGLDCMLRVWDILSGESHGSIYTYNGITCLSCGTWGVVTGTEGGKLEVWCIVSGQRLAFVNAFQSQTTALYIDGDEVYAGSADGELGIWRFNATRRKLGVVYIMEAESSTFVPLRQLAAVVAHSGRCYLGDSGPNIKVVDWKKGHVSRLVNHVGDIGMTDSLTLSPDGFLLAASYLVDSGSSSINVREASSGRYICSLTDNDEGRYLTMSASPGVIVTGGHLLKVWLRQDRSALPKKGKRNSNEVILPNILHKLSSPAVDSASEDETDWASSSDDEVQEFVPVQRGSSQSGGNVDSSGWWCRIL
ncbi:dynein assembly factor with WD repeat domains 1 [Procambarus clarkii]|uniref:dynein assembly factor with WD repeat domains 1 n=1 Tax=Procambarus clarkii TaxID=6728 RepID=UPI001E67793C|nr:lissencephaly-1 homolog [Procambarus clarkii]